MFSLICAWSNGWVNSRDADDLRSHRAHYDFNVMKWLPVIISLKFYSQNYCCISQEPMNQFTLSEIFLFMHWNSFSYFLIRLIWKFLFKQRSLYSPTIVAIVFAAQEIDIFISSATCKRCYLILTFDSGTKHHRHNGFLFLWNIACFIIWIFHWYRTQWIKEFQYN